MRYEYISTLKASDKGDILLVRNENGSLCVQRYRDIDRQLMKKLTEIDCPYIAKTLDFGEDENGFFTIEEYINGTAANTDVCAVAPKGSTDAAQQRATGANEIQLSEKQAIAALLELCKAVRALHKVGIVHRDIKPSNIIIGEDGHIRLIDFDAARLMKEYQSHDTGYLGTIGYAPPEQYGFMQTDARSDIYAFGMTMEELLGKAAEKTKFRRIIRKCTAFDPEKRYSDISLVERALKRRFPLSPVTAIICAAALLISLGALILSCRDEVQKQNSCYTAASETEEIQTAESTSEIIISHVETQEAAEPIQTAEQTHDISTAESAETTVPEGGDITPEEDIVTEESIAPIENVVPDETAAPTVDTEEPVTEAAADIPAPNRMTFETLQDENGRNYDSYEYVFYDDPELHGGWVLCGTARSIPEGDIYFPGVLEGYSPKYITVLPDGVLKTYNAGMRELGSFRWTNGCCIDESTDIHKVEQMFVMTSSDGTQHLIYERKPMYNGDDTMPHIYFIYKRA